MASGQGVVLRWMRNLYIIFSIPVLVWLVVITSGEISRDRQLQQAAADQLVEYISGAAQETGRAIATAEQQPAAAVISNHLVRSEMAVHELYVSLRWYGQTYENAIPSSFVSAYSEELRMMCERLGQSGRVSDADRQLLGEIAHDLQLIAQLYTRDAIMQNQPAVLAAIRQQLSRELQYDIARELVMPAPGTTSP